MPETKLVKLRPAYGKSRQINVIKRDLFISDEVRENMDKDLEKMRYITPTELAKRYGIKISTAKEYLREQEKNHIIKKHDECKSPSLHVYVPVDM